MPDTDISSAKLSFTAVVIAQGTQTQSYKPWHLQATALHTCPRSASFYSLLCVCRSGLHSQQTALEATRCALTAVHFPARRTLAADESPAEPLPTHAWTLADAVDALLQQQGPQGTSISARLHNSTDHSDSAAAMIAPSPHSRTSRACTAQPGSAAAEPKPSTASHSSFSAQSATDVAVQSSQNAGSVSEANRPREEYHAAGYDPAWMLLYAIKVTCQHDLQ